MARASATLKYRRLFVPSMDNLDQSRLTDSGAKFNVESGSKLSHNLLSPSHQLAISVSSSGKFKYIDYDVNVRPGTKTLIELRADSGRIDFGSGFVFGPEGAGYTGTQKNNKKDWPIASASAFCFLVAVFESYDFRERKLRNCRLWLANRQSRASIRGMWEIFENQAGPIGIVCNDYHAHNNKGSFSQQLLIYENIPIE
jgi:hypothetical protein